jgi:hypothetical protein
MQKIMRDINNQPLTSTSTLSQFSSANTAIGVPGWYLDTLEFSSWLDSIDTQRDDVTVSIEDVTDKIEEIDEATYNAP